MFFFNLSCFQRFISIFLLKIYACNFIIEFNVVIKNVLCLNFIILRLKSSFHLFDGRVQRFTACTFIIIVVPRFNVKQILREIMVTYRANVTWYLSRSENFPVRARVKRLPGLLEPLKTVFIPSSPWVM